MQFYVKRRTSPIITIIPMIDILTILLIFFIVTTTFKNPQPLVQIVLPQVKKSVAATNKTGTPLVLSIAANGDVFLDDKPVKVEDLGEAYKKVQKADRPPALKADEKAPVGRMFEVLDALQGAGIKELPAFTREKR